MLSLLGTPPQHQVIFDYTSILAGTTKGCQSQTLNNFLLAYVEKSGIFSTD